MDLTEPFGSGGSFDSGIQGSEGSPQGAQGRTGNLSAERELAPREIPPPAGESAGVRDDSFFGEEEVGVGPWWSMVPMWLEKFSQ